MLFCIELIFQNNKLRKLSQIIINDSIEFNFDILYQISKHDFFELRKHLCSNQN